MCIATIYLDEGKQREEVMRDVSSLKPKKMVFCSLPCLEKRNLLKVD